MKNDEAYCSSCGQVIKKKAEICVHCGVRNYNGNTADDRPYRGWMRAICILYGGLFLIAVPDGIMWYLESGIALVLIIEIISALISLFLVILGLFPDKMTGILNIKDKNIFLAVLVILIIAHLIIVGFQPEPPEGWWYYDPW